MTESRKKKRRKKRPLLVLLIIVILIIAAVVVTHLDHFDVMGIAVVGNEKISDEEIMYLSQIQIGNSIFDAIPFVVEGRINNNLYIEDVKVSWEMPNQVHISVSEKSCLAQFKMKNKYAVTDEEGRVIEITDEMKVATLIEGIEIESAEPGKLLKAKQQNELDKALTFIKKTEESDLFFKRISMKGKSVDAYVFDELKCSGKYDDIIQALESRTLEAVIYDIYQKDIEKGTVNVYSDNYCFFTK